MKLIPISEHPDHAKILWDLLAERPASANISHNAMPTWEEHLVFIASDPYWDWCLVQHGPKTQEIIGSVYLTTAGEIGVAIFRSFQRLGLGAQAVYAMMQKHGPRRYLANVAPSNEPSRKMFEKLGFKMIQQTFALEAE